MGLRFGIFDSFDLSHDTPGAVLRERLAFAQEAERLGFEHYHVTEHHGTPLSVSPSPNVFLAALSQRTTTMRFGALVYVLPGYDPFRLAEEIATLDQLSGGRLDLGVGSGISPIELGYLGVDATQARPIFQERLDAITTALRTGRMADRDATLSVRPHQEPYPELWYASGSASTADWAGANAVHLVSRWEGGAIAEVAPTYWTAWEKHRADPDRLNPNVDVPRLGISGPVVIGESEEQALDLFHTTNALHEQRLMHLWHQHDNHKLDGMFSADRVLANGNAIVGTVDSVRDAVVARVETSGINYLELRLIYGDMGLARATTIARAFMTHVAPAARAAATRSGFPS